MDFMQKNLAKQAVVTCILWPLKEFLCKMEMVWPVTTKQLIENKIFKTSQTWPRIYLNIHRKTIQID